MKFAFILSLFFIFNGAFAEDLTPSFKIKLVSKDGKINFNEYKALIHVECNYKKFELGNIIDQVPSMRIKSCGERIEDLKINSNNEVEVKSINSFDHRQGKNLDHYKLTISVLKPNVIGSVIASIEVEGEKLINKLVESTTPVNLVTFKISDLVVTYKGQNFFDSELVNQKNAGLVFSLNDENYIDYKKKISVRGQNTYYSIAFTGQPQNNGTEDIHTARSITTKEIVLASYGDEVLKQEFRIGFMSDESKFLINSVFVNRTVEELESFKEIELK